MSIWDPRAGHRLGIEFLKKNFVHDDVIVLPSGLQYKVLKEGRGTKSPKAGTPCECHYAGRLIDGTEFDSSYRRGKPTEFAPNQVIKGWTEAMQLMTEGDKWEMYIPMELAYGPHGKLPKIPPAAMLIFTMEIISILGPCVPKPTPTVVDKDQTDEKVKKTKKNKKKRKGKKDKKKNDKNKSKKKKKKKSSSYSSCSSSSSSGEDSDAQPAKKAKK